MGLSAASNERIRFRSTMDISSTITASVSNGSFFIFCKRHFAQCLVVAHAQHTVDGLGFTPAGLAQPFGRPPRGRRQLHTQAHTFQQRHDAAHTGSFARSGTARQQKRAGVCRRFYRLTLLGSINDPLAGLDLLKIASTLRPDRRLLHTSALCGG